MAIRKKRSVSFPPELDARVEAAARAEGIPVSAWLARSAEDRLLIADGLAAMAEWQDEHGAFTEEERQRARQEVEKVIGTRRKRSA